MQLKNQQQQHIEHTVLMKIAIGQYFYRKHFKQYFFYLVVHEFTFKINFPMTQVEYVLL